MLVIAITADFANSLGSMVTGYAALIAVMFATTMILRAAVIVETWIDERIYMVFSRITAFILAGLSVQYVIDAWPSSGLCRSRG